MNKEAQSLGKLSWESRKKNKTDKQIKAMMSALGKASWKTRAKKSKKLSTANA